MPGCSSGRAPRPLRCCRRPPVSIPRWPSQRLDAALGLVPGLVVLPHHNRWHDRSPGGLGEVAAVVSGVGRPDLLGIDEATGLVLEEPHGCRVLGAGSVTLYRAGPGGRVPAVVWTREAPAELESCL